MKVCTKCGKAKYFDNFKNRVEQLEQQLSKDTELLDKNREVVQRIMNCDFFMLSKQNGKYLLVYQDKLHRSVDFKDVILKTIMQTT